MFYAATSRVWKDLPPSQAYALWNEALRECAAQRQEYFLMTLSELMPVIYALGGIAAILETMNSIRDACQRRVIGAGGQ